MIIFSEFLKMACFTTLTGQMTLKNEVKVEFESGFGVLGTYLGGSVIGSCHLKPIYQGEIQMCVLFFH